MIPEIFNKKIQMPDGSHIDAMMPTENSPESAGLTNGISDANIDEPELMPVKMAVQFKFGSHVSDTE